MIVAFAGRIASGKSAVSRAVAEHYSVDRVSFGDSVRSEAKRRGLNESRATLQDLGDELIEAGWDDFCALVVSQANWDGRRPLVVDGVRHLGAIDAFRHRAEPGRLYLVFVDASWETRKARLAQRGVSEREAEASDCHPNESELEAVRDRADLVILNNAELRLVVADAVRALNEAGGLA